MLPGVSPSVEPYRLPKAIVIQAERSRDVATVMIEISREDYLDYPIAPASIWRRYPDEIIFQFHQLIARDGRRLVFETYRPEFPLPAIRTQGDFGSWWSHWAMDSVRDLSATWERLPYPIDGEHDHCLLTWDTIAAYADEKEGYQSSHGWITVKSHKEYIERDRLRIRSAWVSIERRTQLCPKCHKRAFQTSSDEDAPRRLWDCPKCGYSAEEERSLQTDCPNCGGNKTRIALKDGTRTYCYCFGCGSTFEV
jgi:rubrerythrin